MKLIITVGMAFIGPGSEWFWAALTGLVLAGTGVAIYRQLRMQRLQIEDNTKLLRSQAHYNAIMLGQRPLEMLIETAGLAGVMNVACATPEAVNSEDWSRCSDYMFMQFNAWEYFYYQHRDGSIPEELWVGADNYFKMLVATKPGYARFWSESQAGFPDPFGSYTAREFAKKSAPADATSAAV